MAVRQLVLSTDGLGGEFRVEADYQPKAGDGMGPIDYYNGFWITNTTQQPGAIYIARRSTDAIVAGPFTIPANYARAYTDVSGLGTPAQRRPFDVRPQWPA